MEINFSKYQGAGNDFIVLDARNGLPCVLSAKLVAALCHRRFGVGADGLMTIENGREGEDFAMRYFNCDGGESTMCGNGGRCIVRMADDLGIAAGRNVKRFSAVDGTHTATINENGTISLQMIDIERVERVGNDFFVQTGSPHYVIVGQQYDEVLAREKRLQYNANVNFVEIVGDGVLKVRTFERGVEGETWACGTGVTAAAAAVNFASQPTCRRFDVEAVGGHLSVQIEGRDGRCKNVVLTGDAIKVFDGVIKI